MQNLLNTVAQAQAQQYYPLGYRLGFKQSLKKRVVGTSYFIPLAWP